MTIVKKDWTQQLTNKFYSQNLAYEANTMKLKYYNFAASALFFYFNSTESNFAVRNEIWVTNETKIIHWQIEQNDTKISFSFVPDFCLQV
jgi:hypothetical protein